MKRLLPLILSAFLTIGGITLPTDTANAHGVDGRSTIYCTAHKPSGSASYVTHADYYSIQPGLVTFHCEGKDPNVFAGEWEWFVVWDTATGAHWRQGGYAWCGSNYCEGHY